MGKQQEQLQRVKHLTNTKSPHTYTVYLVRDSGGRYICTLFRTWEKRRERKGVNNEDRMEKICSARSIFFLAFSLCRPSLFFFSNQTVRAIFSALIFLTFPFLSLKVPKVKFLWQSVGFPCWIELGSRKNYRQP